MKRLHGVHVLLVLLILSGCAQRSAQVAPDGLVGDFDRRVKEYAGLRGKMEGGAARLKETASPEELVAAEKALAARIVAARATARHGDIFTPAIQRKFRSLLNPELRGLRGRNTRGIIMDDNPGEFPFKVNASYPKQQPLATIPPNILAALPALPEDIEYRFIDKHLILRDARANLIIDYVPNAIS